MLTSTNPVSKSAQRQTTALVLEPVRFSLWPRHILTPGRHEIGLAADCNLFVEVVGLAARHAAIEVGPDRLTLTALDPRTWVNDGPVKRCQLRKGDRLTVGPCSWLVQAATTDDLLESWPQSSSSPTEPKTSPGNVALAEQAAAADSPAPLIEPVTELLEPLTASSPDPLYDDQSAEPVALLSKAQSLLDSATAASLPETALDAITESRPSQLAAPTGPSVNELLQLSDELRELRRDLDRARAAWREETARRELDLAAESTTLSRRGAAVERAEHELERTRQQLDLQHARHDAREEELRRLESDLVTLQRNLAEERQRLELVTANARRELDVESQQQSVAWQEWEESHQRMLADLTRQNIELDERRQNLEADRKQLQGARSELERDRCEVGQAQRELAAERVRWLTEQAAWEQRCAQQESAHAQGLEQLRRQQEQLALEVRERAQTQAEFIAARQQLQHERRLFAEQQRAWQADRESLWNELSERRRRLDQEVDVVADSQQRMESLQRALEQELDEARRHTEHLAAVTAEHEAAAAAATANRAAESSDIVDSEPLNETSAQSIDAELAGSADDSLAADVDLGPITETADEGGLDDTSESTAADFAAIQEALDALAARFEEFSELERRLENKHEELRDLQNELADREEQIESEREAWQQEVSEWRRNVDEHAEQQRDWEHRQQAESAELQAERARWSDHFQQLLVLAEAPSVEPAPILEIAETLAAADAPAAEVWESLAADPLDDQPFDPPTSLASDMESEAEFVEPRDPVAEVSDEPRDDWATDLALGGDLDPEGAESDAAATDSENALPDAESSSVDSAGSETAADVAAAGDLRSELARMFNLPENFAEHSAANDGVDGDEPEGPLSDSAENENDAEDDSWRAQLGALISTGTSQRRSRSEDLTADEGAAEELKDSLLPTAHAPTAPAVPREEDSIASYMELLLARTRKSGAEPMSAEQVATRESLTQSTETDEPAEEVESVSAARPEPLEPRKPVDKEATRAALQSFRDVANLSARNALAKHTWRTTRTELSVQTALAGLCSLATAAYLGGPLWGYSAQWKPALACAVGAAFVGYRAWQSVGKLRQWTQVIEECPIDYSSNDPYIDDQIEALSLKAQAIETPQFENGEVALAGAAGADEVGEPAIDEAVQFQQSDAVSQTVLVIDPQMTSAPMMDAPGIDEAAAVEIDAAELTERPRDFRSAADWATGAARE